MYMHREVCTNRRCTLYSQSLAGTNKENFVQDCQFVSTVSTCSMLLMMVVPLLWNYHLYTIEWYLILLCAVLQCILCYYIATLVGRGPQHCHLKWSDSEREERKQRLCFYVIRQSVNCLCRDGTDSIQLQAWQLTLSVLSVDPLTTVVPLNSEHHTPPVWPTSVRKCCRRENTLPIHVHCHDLHVWQ